MGAIFGGRLPHPPAFVPGGFTTTPRAARITQFKTYLAELTTFIEPSTSRTLQAARLSLLRLLRDRQGSRQPAGVRRLRSGSRGRAKLLRRGRIQQGSASVQSVDPGAITEQVTYSWYADSTNNLSPASGSTQPQYPKGAAYSWLKAPRYGDNHAEGRQACHAPAWLPTKSAHWPGCSSTATTTTAFPCWTATLARAQEALKVAKAMQDWVGQINPSGPVYQPFTTPASGSGYGLTEAPRGALGHWTPDHERENRQLSGGHAHVLERLSARHGRHPWTAGAGADRHAGSESR